VPVVRSLITGGRGFVGQWLAEHLRDLGDEVVAIDQEVEITDPAALLTAFSDAQPDAVYHLAALTHVGQSWDEPLRVLQVNVIGTGVVLAAARQCGTDPKVLVTSSAEVYGAVTDPSRLPLTEGSPTAPLTPYAASKLAAEALVAQAWLGHGQHVITVRPFNHIGPGQVPNFAVPALAKRMVEAAAAGRRTIPVGNLSARRDFTDVRDVVRAYRLLIDSGDPGGIYNVCSGRDVSIRHIADTLLELTGTSLEFETDPALMRPVEVPVLRGDPALLAAVTGWKPEIPLDQTLADVMGYWRDQVADAAGNAERPA
jgi:GDP-4-dehydro-6-deoxy-D-mannose reductase